MKRLRFLVIFMLLSSLVMVFNPIETVSAAPYTFRPSADYSIAICSVSPGPEHWSAVDEAVADDGDYVKTLACGAGYRTDLYEIPNQTTEKGIIQKVTVYFRCKTSSSTLYAYGVIQCNGATSEGAQKTVTNSWATFTQDFTVDPSDGLPWTWNDFDDLKIGIKLQSSASYALYCSQVYVEVYYHPGGIIYSSPTTVSNIGETSAILSGYLLEDNGTYPTSGFWIGNVSQNGTNYQQNLTCAGTYSEGDTFYYTATGLTPGDYYYVKSWVSSDANFSASNCYVLPLASGWNYNIYFNNSLWYGNFSINLSDTCGNFTYNGSAYQSVDFIYRTNTSSGAVTWWMRDSDPSLWTLNNIDSFEDEPNYVYSIHSQNTTRIYFYYDNGTTFQNQVGFITKPYYPTSLLATAVQPNILNLTWTNSTIGDYTNHSVLIRYKTTGYPSSITDGTLLCNESKYNNYTMTGVEADTSYYFSAWTYVNASGSPSYSAWSTSYATEIGSLSGGTYNITVRYENETEDGNGPVNLSMYSKHRFIIHYTDGTDELIFDDGILTNIGAVEGVFDYNKTGNFSINTTVGIIYIDFYWNYSNGSLYQCRRSQILTTGQRNVTFYIRTDLMTYGEAVAKDYHFDTAVIVNPAAFLNITTTHDLDEIIGVYIYNESAYDWIPTNNYTTSTNKVTINSAVFDANTTIGKVEYYTYSSESGTNIIEDTLVYYTYTFKDPSTLFTNAPEMDAYAEVYSYNSSNIKMIIHSEYFSSVDEVHPMLVYDKKYRIGVGKSGLTIPLVGLAPTGEDTTPEPILIFFEGEANYSFFEAIDLDIGRNGATGLYVNYYDTTLSTTSVTMRVYWNGTEVYNETSLNNLKNFTYAAAVITKAYYVEIEVNSTLWSENKSTGFMLYGNITTITDITSLEDLLEKIFGNSPFVNQETNEAVPLSYVMVAAIAFILLTSFGYFSAYLGMMSVGVWLAAVPGFVSGLPLQFSVVGIFLIAMSFIFAIGSKGGNK